MNMLLPVFLGSHHHHGVGNQIVPFTESNGEGEGTGPAEPKPTEMMLLGGCGESERGRMLDRRLPRAALGDTGSLRALVVGFWGGVFLWWCLWLVQDAYKTSPMSSPLAFLYPRGRRF